MRGNSQIIGFEMYNFEEYNVLNGTIHQRYTGIPPQEQGKGYATLIRTYAIEHFKKQGLKGITSVVTSDNIASLKSNQKLGFEIANKFYSEGLGKERYYLICKFDK